MAALSNTASKAHLARALTFAFGCAFGVTPAWAAQSPLIPQPTVLATAVDRAIQHGGNASQLAADEQALVDKAMSFQDDPWGFVLWCYPWGEPGPLEREFPDKWQEDYLKKLGADIRANKAKQANNEEAGPIRFAVASGHGVGKTALTSWLIHWFTSTHPDPQVVVTANTQQQLTTKTWRELAKWKVLAINGHWFEWTATQYKHIGAKETWFATAVPWSKERSEAFAGTHEKHVLVLFDEASAIDDSIWEVTEGAMTTPGAMWLVFGNPTRNTGRFRMCWTKFRDRWNTRTVDSRNARKANKALIKEWERDYGEDSDFFRVRAKGEFPRLGPTQFISVETVEQAIARRIELNTIPASIPRLMGVDVARQGDDKSVVILRQGRKVLKDIYKYRIPDLMDVASRVAGLINEWNPDVVFVDGTGMGAGVYDRLVQLGYTNVVEVHAGMKAADDDRYYNLRIEMWDRMKEWLKTADIPDDRELYEDLIGPEFAYDNRMRLQLERKEDMKARGVSSPDVAEAIALTFAQPVPMKRDDPGNDLEPDMG